ncbi:MKRN2 opposite strand protein-like [Orbicella faveolata]|nr:MKRN2 opposite strand protein-like [Orbicella faveolata]XP_020626239.1 MKRN2 opposite strand protein-like [Orbicella faveolata]
MSGVTEEAVLCMQHCSNQMNIFFTKFPEMCPLCGQSLKSCSLIIPPFRIPSPFVAQNNVSGVLLVKPTKGSFLRDYKSGDDLHVGIVATNGKVYNFDEIGLHADSTNWEQCIAVSVNVDVCVSNSEHWDSKLRQMLCSGLWTYKE